MTATSPSLVRTRVAGLDGVRAFAVLAVIAAHTYVPWLHGGGVGVDIFFVISGFLITYLLLQEGAENGRIDLRRFWLRRILRLYPALLVLVVVVDVLALGIGLFRPNSGFLQAIPATPSVLFYFSNWMIVWTRSAYLGPFGPLWSLSVEEQFYLIWPLIVMISLKFRHSRLMLGVIAGAIAAAAALHRAVTFDAHDLLRTFGTDYRVDMMLCGALLAIFAASGFQRPLAAVSRVLLVPSVGYLLFIAAAVPEFGAESSIPGEQLYYTLGLPLVAITSVSLIAFLLTHQNSALVRILEWHPLAYTGRISYGLYLWHFPIIFAFRAVKVDNPELLLVLTLPATYLVASASWYLIERPLHRTFHARLKPTANRPIIATNETPVESPRTAS